MEVRDAQASYYTATAKHYDSMHVSDGDEHSLGLALFSGLITTMGGTSVLDVGSGTGRALQRLKALNPDLELMGVEPVEALRDIGYEKGLSRDSLVAGDGADLPFENASFDWVCAFAVLHHVANPARVIQEMLRVARVGVFISDSNNFGQGSVASRTAKGLLRITKLWPAFTYARTRGTGYLESQGDGLFYPYSVFSDFGLLQQECERVMLLSTSPSGKSLLWGAPHVAVAGLK